MAGLPTLERKPGGPDNWVERTGGLPVYIERIAKQLHYKQGMTISHAIATAVNTVKRWSVKGTVAKYGDPNHKVVRTITQAQAAQAVAQWEAMKARARATRGAKMAARTVKLSEDNMGFDIRELAARTDAISNPELKALARQKVVDLAIATQTPEDKKAIAALASASKQTLATIGPLLGKVSDQRVLGGLARQVQQASDTLSQIRWWSDSPSSMALSEEEQEWVDLAFPIAFKKKQKAVADGDKKTPPSFLRHTKGDPKNRTQVPDEKVKKADGKTPPPFPPKTRRKKKARGEKVALAAKKESSPSSTSR